MGEGIDRMKEWFGRALRAADFDLKLNDREKGSGWKEATPLFLFNKMMRHVNKMMDPNSNVSQVHSIKVVNYALMIATRLADESPPLSDIELEDLKLAEEERAKGEMPVFDSVEELIGTVEAEPKKTVIREVIYPHVGHTESSVEFGPPIIAGEDESDPIVETGRPPLDLGPLPNGPATEAFSTAQVDTAGDLLKADLRGQYEPNGSEDASYYCPWCEHKSKLASGCHGKMCCIKCGKPINSRFAQMLATARRCGCVIIKEPITSAEMAKYLGTSANWAGQVLAQLGWKSAGWRKGLGARWNPPKKD